MDQNLTQHSLLERLQLHPDDDALWQRFDAVYRPLLLSWLRRYSVQPHDAEDLVQQTLAAVNQELPKFRYDRQKSKFRGWLRIILTNRLKNFWRDRQAGPVVGDSDFLNHVLDQLEDPRSDLSRRWDQEHDEHVSRCLLALIEPDFIPSTWEAFKRVMEGQRPADVAADLGISVNAVYLAKSSVVKRLREEKQGMAD